MGLDTEITRTPPHEWPPADAWGREHRTAAAQLLVHMLDMTHTREYSALALGAREGVYVLQHTLCCAVASLCSCSHHIACGIQPRTLSATSPR